MASSGAAEKDKFHEGKLKSYSHEELGREVSQNENTKSLTQISIVLMMVKTVYYLEVLKL